MKSAKANRDRAMFIPQIMSGSNTRVWLASFFLSSLLLMSAPSPLSAQNRITILNADRLKGMQINGEQVRKLLGNVRLKSDEMKIYCDSALQYLDRNQIRAFGNIELRTEEEVIWADTVFHQADIDFSKFLGRVIIENDSTTVFGSEVDYLHALKIAFFRRNIRLEDTEGVLTAQSGVYFQQRDSAIFRGNVQVRDSLTYLEGDSLFSNRKSDFYKLYGDVFGDDEENGTRLTSRFLQSDSTGRNLLKEDAYIMKVDRDSTASDTTHLWGDAIIYHDYDSTYTFSADRNVRIWSADVASRSDSAFYSDHTERFELFKSPTAWHKTVQLTGPYIEIQLKDQAVDRLESYPEPFIVQQDTVLDRLNQAKGDSLLIAFKEGDIRFVEVFPNGELLYFTENEGKSDGAIQLTAASYIRLLFEDGEIVKMKSEKNIDGVKLPESDQTTEKQLDGFNWTPELRPLRPDTLITPKWEPIPNRPPFSLPERYLSHLLAKQRAQADSLATGRSSGNIQE